MTEATAIRIHKPTREKLREIVDRGLKQSFVLDTALEMFHDVHITGNKNLIGHVEHRKCKEGYFWHDDNLMQYINSHELASLVCGHIYSILHDVAEKMVVAEHDYDLSDKELRALKDKKYNELLNDFDAWISDPTPQKRLAAVSSLLRFRV